MQTRRYAICIAMLVLLADALAIAADPQKGILPFTSDESLDAVREKIRHNGYQFTVGHNWVVDMPPEMKREFFSRGRRRAAALESALASADIGPLADHLGEPLPASFDWRAHEGRSYIGPIRDQGNCGSCYAFAACAAAEGTYNWAKGLFDAACVDFSESFIIWCLGGLEEYEENFYGCDGADYSYSELEALVEEGVCLESAYPYTIVEPASCTHWNDPRTQFTTWQRVPCGDIEAIKTAIMTYGPVDAAVLADQTAFMGYSGGIYEDALTDCPGVPCEYTETDHCIALVGWDDSGDPEKNGYWILRNSWGTTWGESGYMRIKYRAARVSCEVAYLVYGAPQPTPSPRPVTPTPTPVPAPPGLIVTLNQSAYMPGDTLSVSVSFQRADVDWDGYLLFSGPSGYHSILRGGLVRGVWPIVVNARERPWPCSARVCSLQVPYGVQGRYECIGAILPTGYAPTMDNARGRWGQLGKASFEVLQYRER